MAKGFRHGSGGDMKKVPVLDENFPQDVSIDAVGTSVTFEVVIAEDGKPVGYTYQWYYDNIPVDGEIGATYTRKTEKGSHSVYCIITNKAGFVTSRTATVTSSTLWLYNSGDQCKDVTNGYTVQALPSNNTSMGGAPTVRYNSTNIYIDIAERYGGTLRTTNKIDLTNYQTLHFNGVMKHTVASEVGWAVECCICIWSEMGAKKETNRVAYLNSNVNGDATLNVASLKGSYYIGFYVSSRYQGGASSIQVNKLYLT